MAEVTIKTATGKNAETLAVADSVFGVEPNLHCIRVALDAYRAAQRLGTHATKTRGQVRGGGKKPWRQKGTGRARQGSIRAVQWRGGAISFGPSPRDYSFRANQKVKASAMRSVLSEYMKSGKLIAIEDPKFDEPRTRLVVEMLGAVGAEGKALFLTESVDVAFYLSTRNLAQVNCLPLENINIYDLLTHDCLVVTKSALKRLEEVYG
jgi:large subunit ribosomal protein L4